MCTDFAITGPLGGQMQFDRGVIMFDDMEGALLWEETATGGDDELVLHAGAAYVGTKGLRLKTRTTDVAAGDYMTAWRKVCYPLAKRLIYRLRWRVPYATGPDYVEFGITVKDGANEHQFSIRYTPATSKIEYLNSGGTFTEISELAQDFFAKQWDTFEVGMDLDSWGYMWVISKGIKVDLAKVACQKVGASTDRSVLVSIKVVNVAAAPIEMNVDCVYVGEYERL